MFTVAEALIKRGSLKIQGKEFILSNPTFPSISLKPVVEVDDEESLEEKEKRSRTVVVKNVTEEMEEIITVFLENPKKGGGEIESNEFDEKNETLTLRFVEKESKFTKESQLILVQNVYFYDCVQIKKH